MSEQIVARRTYVWVFVALAILTGLTAGVAHLDLGPFNVAAALIIALVKAGLVALFFMHLKQSRHLVLLIALLSLVWLSVLLLLSFADYATRSWTS
jgi:cytochrome c oxidase subunit IV